MQLKKSVGKPQMGANDASLDLLAGFKGADL